MRINISLGADLLEETDDYCAEVSRTRSNVISLALKEYIRKNKECKDEPERN